MCRPLQQPARRSSRWGLGLLRRGALAGSAEAKRLTEATFPRWRRGLLGQAVTLVLAESFSVIILSHTKDGALMTERALAGIRVLDFSQLLPGPYATWVLAGMGAEVTKIEPPGGDPARWLHNGTMFELFGSGKRSVVIDLKDPEQRVLALRAMTETDVVVESLRPGNAARLGIGYEQARAANRDIVYCSIRGFPPDAPQADQPGHDAGYLALAGALDIPGSWSAQSLGPVRPAVPIADLAAGAAAAQAILAALLSRSGSGGQHIEISIYDLALLWGATRAASRSVDGSVTHSHLDPANDMYRCADGEWLALSAIETKFWRALCEVLSADAPELASARDYSSAERRNEGDRMACILRTVLATRARDEWLMVLQRVAVPAQPVRTIDEALHDQWLEDPRLDTLRRTIPSWTRVPAAGSAPALDADGDQFRARHGDAVG
jgi:crotonobetainyl-CoA:carnitine CoA-transferase CaiB-like acyl-CoA transferase